MNEFLRKFSSISTLAGVVIAVIAVHPRGSLFQTIILSLFSLAWLSVRIYRWLQNPRHKAHMPRPKKPKKEDTVSETPSSEMRVRRPNGRVFEVPNVADGDGVEEDDPAHLLLQQVCGRVTDLLQSYYPGASWKWLTKDPLAQIVSGGVARIKLLSVPDYTYADISFADPTKLDVQMIRTDPLVPPVVAPAAAAAAAPVTAPNVPVPVPAPVVVVPEVPIVPAPPALTDTDVNVWFSMIGQRALTQLITDLNISKCSKIIIEENGDVYAVQEGAEPEKKKTLDRMPAKRYWEQLKRLMCEQELTVAIEQNHLVVNW